MRYSGIRAQTGGMFAGSICDIVVAYPVGDRRLTCFAKFTTRGPRLRSGMTQVRHLSALECPSLRSIAPIKNKIITAAIPSNVRRGRDFGTFRFLASIILGVLGLRRWTVTLGGRS